MLWAVALAPLVDGAAGFSWPQVLLLLLGPTGVFGVVARVVYRLHRDAIQAHDQRAADWRAAWERETKRGDELAQQLTTVVDGVRTLGKP